MAKKWRSQYHPAFYDAVIQMFELDGEKYDYEKEYTLNTLPNYIDLVVVQKGSVNEHCNAISGIFRKYNIFEYKSPGQHLSVRVYQKTMGYVYHFASMKKCKTEDITVSFVREGKPEKLLEYFAQNDYNVTQYEAGIYHVTKVNHVDMQVIVTRELDNRYIWLKVLTNKLTFSDAELLAEAAGKEKNEEGQRRINVVLDLVSSLNENKEWMKELIGMGAFRDLFKEEFEEKDRQIKNRDKQIKNLSEQVQSKDKQLQNKDEQLQSKDEQLQSKDKQIEYLKKLLKSNKIAMF
ncbi:MAG: hypothetical protein K6G76_06185 [Lachnospiraceae bacterium]|nr:hypothetical protein [Lachnospiraceae bacterium]